MDYNQEQFFRMQMDVPKMPFYMSYPMQNLYLTEMEYEKDMDRMKELYPRDVSRIMDVIEDECDKMEYEGSLMFDEYPDRLTIHGGGLRGGTADGANDHRVVMSAAIAGMFCREPVLIRGAEAVHKSYPDFFEDFKKLGGLCDVI